MSTVSADPQIFLDALEAHRVGLYCQDMHGYEWGDPTRDPKLLEFVMRYIHPYVRSDQAACDIGSGGGRMTQFLRGFQRIYAADIHQEMHAIRQDHLKLPYITSILSDGEYYPDMGTIDYALAFKVFDYSGTTQLRNNLRNLCAHLRPDAQVVLTYTNVNCAQRQEHTRPHTALTLRRLVMDAGYVIREENSKLFKHCHILRLSAIGDDHD